MHSKTYPHLQDFLSAWFHQDFDVAGDSIEAIADEFRQVSSASDATAVATDIHGFIAAFEGSVEDAFSREFEIEVDPTALAPSIREFLMRIANRLAVN